jgi:hypothetical protein
LLFVQSCYFDILQVFFFLEISLARTDHLFVLDQTPPDSPQDNALRDDLTLPTFSKPVDTTWLIISEACSNTLLLS